MIIFLLLATPTLAATNTCIGASAGTVTMVSKDGNVRLTRAGDPEPRVVRPSTAICEGDRLETWFDAWVEVSLSGGASGRLAGHADVDVRMCGLTHRQGRISLHVPDALACPFTVQLGASGHWVGNIASTVVIDRSSTSTCDPATTIAVSDTVGRTDGHVHQATVYVREPQDGGATDADYARSSARVVVVVSEGETATLAVAKSGSVDTAIVTRSATQPSDALTEARSFDLSNIGLSVLPNPKRTSARPLQKDTTSIWVASERPPLTTIIDGHEVPSKYRRESAIVVGNQRTNAWALVFGPPADEDHSIELTLAGGETLRGRTAAGTAWYMMTTERSMSLPVNAIVTSPRTVTEMDRHKRERAPISMNGTLARRASDRIPRKSAWMLTGVEQNSAAAIAAQSCALRQPASAPACYSLALAFKFGERGAQRDLARSRRAMQLSCDLGLPDACVALRVPAVVNDNEDTQR